MSSLSVWGSHVAFTVADLQYSIRYYNEGLTFEPARCFERRHKPQQFRRWRRQCE